MLKPLSEFSNSQKAGWLKTVGQESTNFIWNARGSEMHGLKFGETETVNIFCQKKSARPVKEDQEDGRKRKMTWLIKKDTYIAPHEFDYLIHAGFLK